MGKSLANLKKIIHKTLIIKQATTPTGGKDLYQNPQLKFGRKHNFYCLVEGSLAPFLNSPQRVRDLVIMNHFGRESTGQDGFATTTSSEVENQIKEILDPTKTDKQGGFSSSLLNSNWARDDSIKSTINSRLSGTGTSSLVTSAINLGSSASAFNNLDLVTQWPGLWLLDTPGQWKGNKWNQSSYSSLVSQSPTLKSTGMTSAKVESTGYSVDFTDAASLSAKYRKLDLLKS